MMVGLNLGRLLLKCGSRKEAIIALEQAWEAPYKEVDFYAPLLDFFRFEWERVRWEQGGREKLVRWQIAVLLADLLGCDKGCDKEKARYFASQAVKLRPDLGWSWVRLAKLLPDDAPDKVEILERALKLEPADPWIRLDLIRSCWHRGQFARALSVAGQTSRLLSELPYPERARRLFQSLVQDLKMGSFS